MWTKETTSRSTRRLIEAPTKTTLEYWSGLRKATASILIQLRTERIGLGAELSRIYRRKSARCDCDLSNHTLAHILLKCPLHQDERNRIRSALSDSPTSESLYVGNFLTSPEPRKLWPSSYSTLVFWANLADSRHGGSG